jgi:hypothetical protein
MLERFSGLSGESMGWGISPTSAVPAKLPW